MTPRDIVANLVEDGPVSYRTIAYGLFNGQRQIDYFELDPRVHREMFYARRLGNKWKDKLWRQLSMPDPDRNTIITYLVAKDRKDPKFNSAKHEDLMNALYLAYLGAPTIGILEWSKPTLAADYTISTSWHKKWTRMPDRRATLTNAGNERTYFFELERWRKDFSRTRQNFDWYREAYRQNKLPKGSLTVWIAPSLHDREWLRSLAKKQDVPSNVRFTTLPELLKDPVGALYPTAYEPVQSTAA